MNFLSIAPIASITATGGGPDVSIANQTYRGIFDTSILNTAGTNPTLTRKLQHSEALARGAASTTAGTNDIELREGATTNVALGALFTQSGARQIKSVLLRLRRNASVDTAATLALQIRTSSSSLPTTTVLGTSANVVISALSAADYRWVEFTFANPVDLADATVYHFVLTGSYTASADNNVTWRAATVASGGNRTSFDNTNWAATATQSFEFIASEYNFADVTGGGFTQATATSVNQGLTFWVDNLRPVVRVFDTIGGTNNPAFACATSLVSEGRTQT